MPQYDTIHLHVRQALIADGWTITNEQKKLAVHKTAHVYGVIDILAEQAITATRAGRKIAVEVKSFLGDSPSAEVMEAVGQYIAYRSWFARVEPDREVWLAVPHQRYQAIFTDIGAQAVIQDEHIRIIVVHVVNERIVEWIN